MRANFSGFQCWKYEPEDRPDIYEINSILNSIESENNDSTTISNSKESKITKRVRNKK
ncbi:hypothetical protein C1645_842060 [Glomus cerebriforme]|uniref:Serine-threonine/tyrosine-protein kinase catalytic domain-containing protein n=1 Tax=Glomus cerebriforme TaxID=658196 RepID=A0A397RX49_9GLOM|nr:hypothetical protein C1645_842060 [Glomus cerebriforme]